MNLDDKVFVMDDDTEYLVVESVEYDGEIYVYLVNDKDERDNRYMKLVAEDDMELEEIDPELFDNQIYPLFVKKFAE